MLLHCTLSNKILYVQENSSLESTLQEERPALSEEEIADISTVRHPNCEASITDDPVKGEHVLLSSTLHPLSCLIFNHHEKWDRRHHVGRPFINKVFYFRIHFSANLSPWRLETLLERQALYA